PARISGVVVSPDLLPVSDAPLGPAFPHHDRLDGRVVLPSGHHQGRARRRARPDAAGGRRPPAGLTRRLVVVNPRSPRRQAPAVARGGPSSPRAPRASARPSP